MTDDNTTDAARELYFYLSNCARAMAQYEHLLRNYEKKRAKGVYNSALAVKGALHAVNAAAQSYARDHADAREWHKLFSTSDRAAVAFMLIDDAEAEWAAGNFWSVKP